MIIDNLANADKYTSLHKGFSVAFDFIKKQDLQALEVGVHEVAEGVKIIVSDKDGVAVETAVQKFECHNKNIDIQLCIDGIETIGWKPRNDCKDAQTEYSDEKDVQFFNDAPDMFFKLKGGQFVIFYPNDVHCPMIGDARIKKLVVKVAI